MQRTPEEERKEQEDGDLLAAMMGGDLDSEVARRVLRKHNGNLQKAADAILEGDRGEEAWNTTPSTQVTSYVDPKAVNAQAPPPVIDLTAAEDDADYSRALQLSMQTSQDEVKFGPSERAPDPAWQMVHSNAPVANITQDDHTLTQAIQASLNDFNPDETEVFPFEETVREGGRPIALRPELSGIAYAALVLQGLFFVPQVRQSVAGLLLPDIDVTLPRDSPERAIWNLIELFVNMDLAQLSAIVDKEVLPSLDARPWNGFAQSLGDISADFVRHVGTTIENHLNAQKDEDQPNVRLFNFFHGTVELRSSMAPKIKRADSEGSVVVVDIGGDHSAPNDLMSRLSFNLSQFHDAGSQHDVIFEPSELVIFQLKTPGSQPSFSGTSKSSPDPFIYQKTIYMDQFLVKNLEIANRKRALEREMLTEINQLVAQKQILTRHNDRDTLNDLRASLHYFEHVARSEDEQRREAIDRSITKLKNILKTIGDQVEEIDRKIEQLKAGSAVVYDCPELQNYRYDLRVVLVHTGVPGRKQIYSYVQDSEGVWWKTVDYTVTEVPEDTVLTDPTGLHLGAGPYLLIYSRYLSDEQKSAPVIWPQFFTDHVEEHNKTFLSLLPPELSARARPTDTAATLDISANPVERELSLPHIELMGVSND